MRKLVLLILPVLALVSHPRSVAAQTGYEAKIYEKKPQLGVDLLYLVRAASSQEFGKSGWGFQLRYAQPLDKFALTALRVDASYNFLSEQEKTVQEGDQYSTSTHPTNVKLEDHALLLAVAFQVQVPRGVVRPFAAVRGGVGRFGTDAKIAKYASFNSYPTDSTGQSDNAFIYGAYAGLQLMIAPAMSISLGVDGLRTTPLDALVLSGVKTDANRSLVLKPQTIRSLSYGTLFVGCTLW